MQQLEIKFDFQELSFQKLTYSEKLKRLACIDLSFIGQNGRVPLHNVHPFPAKFPPQLPNIFITHLTNEHDVVLDPMMGSCTTLIESLRLNRAAIGCDIDPLAILIANAKLLPDEIDEIIRIGKVVVNHAFKSSTKNINKIETELENFFDQKTFNFVNYWFKKSTQIELYCLIREIEKVTSEGVKYFLKMVFSSIIIAKSGGVSLAIDLAHTRPHLSQNKKIPSAFEEYNKKISSLAKTLTLLGNPKFQIYQADARNIPIEKNSVDLIVTSPPYANNAIDYLRAHKFSLIWFGYSLKSLSGVRDIFIGTGSSKAAEKPLLPQLCYDVVDRVQKKDKLKSGALLKYYYEMYQVINEMFRVLKRNKTAVVVVATSSIKGVDSETHTCLAEIGKMVGFSLIGMNKRQLDRDRRMMPARWQKNTTSQIEERMHEEYVIIFQKLRGVTCQ